MENIFFDICVMIIAATVLAYIAKILRQPRIPAYILAGLLIGPFCLGMVTNQSVISTLAEIGIAFMLFVVGLELDFKKLKDIGPVVSIGTALRIMIFSGISYVIALLLGFSTGDATFIAIILAFSSTMVVVKLLADKKQLDTLHGRIVIGILLIEDILAILVLLTYSSPAQLFVILLSLLKGMAILVASYFGGRYLFMPIFKFAAKSNELLFLMALSVCFSFSYICYLFKFSIVIGAFLAGVVLANLPYNVEIVGRVKPLRDFFATLFFVTLGLQIAVTSIRPFVIPLIIFSFMVVVLKPVLVMVLSSAFGYTKRTSFLTALSLTQISEFSLIIAAQGLMLGKISQDMFSFTILLAIITIAATSYLMKNDNTLYSRLSGILAILESKTRKKELVYDPSVRGYDIILVGYNRIGYSIAKTARKLQKKLLVVDFNPDLIKRLINEKIPCIYGDIGDMEIIERLDFRKARIVISTIPDEKDNSLLIKKVKEASKKIVVFVTANQVDEALDLYNHGADYVILPHFLGGDHVSIILEDITTDMNKLIETKLTHIEELRVRKGLGHEHPRHDHRHD